MKLWTELREKMLSNPHQLMTEKNVSMTFEEVCIFAEQFSKQLSAPYYCILCHSEFATALAVLACFAAGKPAIPLPERYGESHYKKILKSAVPPAILTDMNGYLQIHETYEKPIDNLPEELAVVLFTSGSTGKPKGVMLSEKNLLCNVKSIAEYYPLKETDRFLITRPLYHSSVMTGEFLLSLWVGSEIVFSSEMFHPIGILNLLRDKKITSVGSTPTLMFLLSRFVRNHTDLSVRLLSISGECVTKGIAETIKKAFPYAKVYCGYGLSEASPRVAYLPAEDFDNDPTCAGIPIPGVRVKICDPEGKEVKNGDVGEILVRGENVMLGYLKGEARTKRVLRQGWLHTGDLAYFDAEHRIHICGRKDDMIIRAGMNIYPAEIENALSDDDRIEELSAYGFFDGETEQIALEVKGKFSSEKEVYALCCKRLPPFQIPAKIKIVTEFSRTLSGKRKRVKKNEHKT